MKKFVWYLSASIFIFWLFTNQPVLSGSLPSEWDKQIEDINLVSIETDSADLTAIGNLKAYVIKTILPIAKSIFLPLALIYLVILIFWLTVAAWDEDVISSFKVKVWFLILWLILISIAEPIWEVFDPTVWNNKTELWNIDELEILVNSIIEYFTILSWWIAVIVMTISWIRLVVSKWDDTIIEEQKRSFTYSFIWLIVILVFKRFIEDILYVNHWFSWPNENAASDMSAEIMWIIAWAMEFLAFWCLWVIVLAWFYYIFSLWDDDASTKAKATIKNAALGLLLIIVSYTIVATFIPH